jgi:hypothetical protein
MMLKMMECKLHQVALRLLIASHERRVERSSATPFPFLVPASASRPWLLGASCSSAPSALCLASGLTGRLAQMMSPSSHTWAGLGLGELLPSPPPASCTSLVGTGGGGGGGTQEQWSLNDMGRLLQSSHRQLAGLLQVCSRMPACCLRRDHARAWAALHCQPSADMLPESARRLREQQQAHVLEAHSKKLDALAGRPPCACPACTCGGASTGKQQDSGKGSLPRNGPPPQLRTDDASLRLDFNKFRASAPDEAPTGQASAHLVMLSPKAGGGSASARSPRASERQREKGLAFGKEKQGPLFEAKRPESCRLNPLASASSPRPAHRSRSSATPPPHKARSLELKRCVNCLESIGGKGGQRQGKHGSWAAGWQGSRAAGKWKGVHLTRGASLCRFGSQAAHVVCCVPWFRHMRDSSTRRAHLARTDIMEQLKARRQRRALLAAPRRLRTL